MPKSILRRLLAAVAIVVGISVAGTSVAAATTAPQTATTSTNQVADWQW